MDVGARTKLRESSRGSGSGEGRASSKGGAISKRQETREGSVDRPDSPSNRILESALPEPVCSYFDVSADRRSLICVGTSPEKSQTVYVVDLRKGNEARKLLEPAKDVMEFVQTAMVARQDFVNTDGVRIDGWLFYPQGFDSAGIYPLVVTYYGGVIPMGEYFNGPAHWLAGQGYFVYVLTPRGATGYGQHFADAHVNDWGGLSAKDVIEGVGKLLAANAFLDKARIGCYGGSYGGFLTMSLLTQTDLFKAAVSWYGISNIASYWGAGWWGYLYSDVASALSFPWNRPDVYAEKSPLFHADKLKGALLLMHGLDDVNVPALESDQMFTALKVLDKEVVYIRWKGEGHGLRGTPQDSMDGRLIMLEWFDKHLKGEPGAWEERWKAEASE
jgi:dipeptidyl aminopeptidase/acylaminoacyl peptidase